MSKSGDEITKQLEELRQKVEGTKKEFVVRPYSTEIEVPIDSLEEIKKIFHESGLLVHKGQPVFVYIRDHTVPFNRDINSPYDCNKIHFSFCGTLRQMLEENRFESRYHVTNRTDDQYIIDYGRGKVKPVKLYPCQNCLRNVDYKCFQIMHNSRDKKAIVENFKARDAMELLKQRLDLYILLTRKLRPDHRPSGYAPNHKHVSLEYRKSKNFTCEVCGVNLSKREHRQLTDTHHIDGNKRNNNRQNLKCLCKLCHSEEHRHYSVDSYYKRIIIHLRREQNIG